MPLIELETYIHSSINICFDISRSIDLHTISTAQTKEKAISGTTSGLINLGESVTWEARHFGLTLHLTTHITKYHRPLYFRDEQLSGPFRFLQHDHYFEQDTGRVIMKDRFAFQSPFGIAGKLVDALVLKRHLRHLLLHRNSIIKAYAESGRWESVLNSIS